mmetsp:Transcript_10366/g.20898  ORF Transcript_10366/g.20898 Transcript_10366/m.20898 type:complete len:90 (+) Transcript_10366:7-276(+)
MKQGEVTCDEREEEDCYSFGHNEPCPDGELIESLYFIFFSFIRRKDFNHACWKSFGLFVLSFCGEMMRSTDCRSFLEVVTIRKTQQKEG